jgi:hypothetical protein
MAHPIWKDYIHEYGADRVEFSISYNNGIIYEGKAVTRPGESSVFVKINDICADYMRSAFPSVFPTTGGVSQPYVYTFQVSALLYYGDHFDSIEVDTIEFFYDWSYDYSRDYTQPLLSAPILRKIPRNAPLLYSSTSGDTYIELVDAGAYSRAFNSAFDIANPNTILSATSVANNVFNLADIVTDNDVKVIVYGGDGVAPIEYELTNNCNRWMLYYLNAHGGWDFLTIEGKELQADNYTRHSIGRSYDNSQSRNRGMSNYRNDIARKWQLRTLWIDDQGAQNMHHLLGSTDVYLYDLSNSLLYPVTLDNSSCEYRTYKNNGNQLVRYDIEASLAQNITRR